MNYKSNLAVKEESHKVHAATAVGTVLTLVGGSAFAAVPADVTTAITGAVADVAVVGAAVIVVMVGIKVFKWMRSAL
ncbi:MAG: methyltransferase [Nitrosomonas sp.]|uniref:major capsid protein n=1 Tax=Nitrosomonas sp. TaxID=42353 RepID=UPI0032ED016A